MKVIRSNKKGFRIHSPFVYNLITNVLFGENRNIVFSEIEKLQVKKEIKLQLNLLCRLIDFFKPEKVLFIESFSEEIVKVIKSWVISGNLHSTMFDLEKQKEIVNTPFVVFGEESFLQLTVFPENNSVWFIKKKRNSKTKGLFFQTLPEYENGRITIEFKNAGIVIFDKKFPSQDYVIK